MIPTFNTFVPPMISSFYFAAEALTELDLRINKCQQAIFSEMTRNVCNLFSKNSYGAGLTHNKPCYLKLEYTTKTRRSNPLLHVLVSHRNPHCHSDH